ncbi:hypothetical protein C8P63_1437 [Melghirimyces profundicolus]|uniref:Uncharacterized protein n=1 Tax=Melghirimyces profundicolus TaxID=1242148 RepID=A0A2T6AYK5_9BACL|nr:hypothetical protein C8P63_1437 [Melghirimyces profundicolus]
MFLVYFKKKKTKKGLGEVSISLFVVTQLFWVHLVKVVVSV